MSNVHALQDVLRYLNSHDFKREGGAVAEESEEFEGPLQIVGDMIVASYASLRFSSSFYPILDAEGTQIGYKANLRAAPNANRNYGLDISKLAVGANDRGEIVYLDRLTRTLHTLNYLAEDLKGDLHMSVNPQHLLEVHGNHGAVFEQILSKCGLDTDRIVLEISEYVSNKEHLQLALAGWRQRRYKIAFDNFTPGNLQIAHVLKHRPDIVKIDVSSFNTQVDTIASRQLVETAIEEFRKNGIQTIVTHINHADDYELARCFRFSAMQGSWLIANVAHEISHQRRVVFS